MKYDWCVSSRTKRPHLYLDGARVAICGRGYVKPGEPIIRVKNDTANKCPRCLQIEKRLIEYPDGELIDGTITA